MTPPALRADAARNLERIEAAAREVFAERGFDASMEEIARRAGVGKGTLFRRFPTKEALIVAVLLAFQRDVEGMVDTALAEGPDPLGALRSFMCAFVRLQSANAGFFDAIAARHDTLDVPPELAERGIASCARILAPARAAGAIRQEIEPGDLLASLKMLGTAARPGNGPPTDEAYWVRYVELLLAGMRPGGPPLPGEAYDPCARVAAQRRGGC